jgi:YARHG domain
VLSDAQREARRDASVNFGACGGRKHVGMSTSPANSDDRLSQVAQSFRSRKDEGLLSALSGVPNFPFGDATTHVVDRKSDDLAQAATPSGPPPYPPPQAGESISFYPPPPAGEGRVGARDSDVKRPRMTIIPPDGRHETDGNERRPPDLTPAWVIQPRGYVDLGRPTPRLRRRRHGLKKLLVTSAIAAMVGGAVVVEILMLVEDSDFPSLPQFVSGAPPRAKPAPAPTDFRAIINLSEVERVTQAVSTQPAVSLQPMVRSENPPTASGIDVTLPPGSAYEKMADKVAATRQPPSIAIAELAPLAAPELTPLAAPELAPLAAPELRPRPEPFAIATPQFAPMARPEPTPLATPEPRSITTLDSPPIARLEQARESPAAARPEPTPESPPISQAPSRIGKVVAADRTGLLLADSNVRYLTRAELQRLSADRLHIARNEIFARRGRYFKDDALRAYFEQFPWYQPRAWDVPLTPVERANVGLIASIEAPAPASRSITGPVPAETNTENSFAFADPSRRYLTPEELQGLSADQLIIIRNEIFARKGRYFKDDALRTYFSQFPWYQPYAWDVPLSPIEQANVKLVQSFEQTASVSRPAATRAGRAPPM